jgi:probable blue pigment (indigoidine) exporter
MSMPSVPGRTALVLIAAAASWGLGTVVSKHALDEVPALSLLPIQLAASVAVLVVLVRRNAVSGVPSPGDAILAHLGLLNPGLAYALTLLGLASISASLVVLIGAIEPVLILVLAVWFLGERVTSTMIVLSGVALGGTLLVVYDPASSGQWLGMVLVAAGVGCCAIYTIIGGSERPARPSGWWPVNKPTGLPSRSSCASPLGSSVAG